MQLVWHERGPRFVMQNHRRHPSLVREDSKNKALKKAEFERRIRNFEFYGTCFCGCLCNSVGLENELADEMGEQSEGERRE